MSISHSGAPALLTDPRAATWADHTIGHLPAWGLDHVEELGDVLLSSSAPFPCTFAVSALKKTSLRFGFVDDIDDEATWRALPDLLRSYLAVYRTLSRDTSLVVFFGDSSPNRDIAEYERRFWAVLRYLHGHDVAAWPEGLPTDPDDPLWEFAFHGTPIFVVCNTPAHRARRSRHSSTVLVTFQPRWVFEGLEADSPRGAASRRVIRRRLAAYDEEEPAPVLGSYGAQENREWKQYFLPDRNDDDQVGASCPFHATGSTRPAATGQGQGARVGPRYRVVVNDEEQYSVWLAHRPAPLGWRDAGPTGTREECLAHIERVWVDMVPSSLRDG